MSRLTRRAPARPVRPALLARLAAVTTGLVLAGGVAAPATAAPAAPAAPRAATAAAAPAALASRGLHHHHHHVRLARAKALKGAARRAAAGRASFGQRVLAEASRHAGAPYVYGAVGPDGFDCSGFTSFVYRAAGVSLPRTSYAQYAATRHLPASQAIPGDLIFLDGLGHVAIYAGHGMMWDAPVPGRSVGYRPIYGYYLVSRV